MAYTPTNWQIGDIITAEKLNKIENGINSINSYNLAITEIGSNLSVIGVSPQQLLSTDGFVKVLYNYGSVFYENSKFVKTFNVDRYVLTFYFDDDLEFSMSVVDGLASYGYFTLRGVDGTWNYSNGSYTFTFNEGGGK